MSKSEGDLVLITGATGYLGYAVLVEALKAGYNIRLAIRSESKLQTVLNAPTVKDLLKESKDTDRITWIIVPDMAVPGAYDEAVKGVKYIIHVASPIPSFGAPNPPSPEDYEAHFIRPTLMSDLGMLKSAAREPTVKRVVLTSSAVANVPFEYFKGEGNPKDRVFTAADRIPAAPGPWEGEFEAYSAGKAGALNEAERFMREQKPGFDLIPVIPGWIFGRNELITNAAELKQGSTNSVLLAFLLGGKSGVPLNGNWVLGTDAAKTHVLALDPAVKGNQAFVASFDATWEDALKVLKSKYSEAIRAGKVSIEGKQGTIDVSMPPTETENTLGFKFQSLDTIVSEVVDQWLELNA